MSAPPLRVAIVDDEPLARSALRSALTTLDGVEIVGEAEDGREAIGLLRTEAPDVVFLDVRMPGVDGFGVLEPFDDLDRPDVVFVTAHDDAAVKAFEVRAIDYLLKPFDDRRLEATLERIRARRREREAEALGSRLEAFLARPGRGEQSREVHTRIQVRRGEHIRFLPVARVRYIETDGNHLVLHLVDGDTARIRRTLKDLLRVLDPRIFVRIHRSTVVNVDHLREVQPWFSGDYVALMKGGEELRVSRHYRDGLLRGSF